MKVLGYEVLERCRGSGRKLGRYKEEVDDRGRETRTARVLL